MDLLPELEIIKWDCDCFKQKEKRPCWNCYFLFIADVVSLRGDCTRKQASCVLVKDNRIVGTGYNGSPPGGKSCLAGECPRGKKTLDQLPGHVQGNNDYSDCIAIHAEPNAIVNAHGNTAGAIAYMNGPPCDMCGKLLLAAGIRKVIYAI